jgi:hypothetical protein
VVCGARLWCGVNDELGGSDANGIVPACAGMTVLRVVARRLEYQF